jgi:hypothetical protein
MSQVTITETFKDADGNSINPTSVVFSDPTGAYGIKRNDTDAIIVAANVPMVNESVGVYTYTFDEPVGADTLTYTYWIKWVYQGHTDYDERIVTGETDDDLLPTRSMDKYLTWIANEFKPLTLITPEVSIKQCIENAIRYWNTHSAYKISSVYSYPTSSARIQVDPEFKSIVDVMPTQTAEHIWSSHPLWTLTGITVLDNVTTDLIMMSEAFRNYRIYVGTNFRWVFERSVLPTTGGHLYCTNVPGGVQSLFVVGTKRITKNEDIKSQYIVDWILYYSKALVKQIEGNTLRKTMIIDTPLDGQALVDEGREDQKELQESLARDSRWIIFMKRK